MNWHWIEELEETKQIKSDKMKYLQSAHVYTVLIVFSSVVISTASGRVAFEKLTDYDFSGQTYYSVKNLSLYECQGWCREEADCQAAAFSFVLNPLTPAQETLCQLQNDSSAHNPSAVAQRSASMYYMVKLQVCNVFEKFKLVWEIMLICCFCFYVVAKRKHLHATMGIWARTKQNHSWCW